MADSKEAASQKTSLTTAPVGGDKKQSSKKSTTRSSKDKTSTSDENVSMESRILSALTDIKQQQQTSDEKFSQLVERVSALEHVDYSYEDEYYTHEEGEIDEEGPSSPKRPKPDSESRFALMSKRLIGHEIYGAPVEETLASNINDVFINGLKEEEYNSMIKDDVLPRPENCEALKTVKCNKMVWDFLSTNAKYMDKKLQNTETSLIKGATLIVKAVDSIAKAEIQIKELGIDISSPLDNCQDALSLLGHANKQLNMARREALRPEMRRPYSHLCSSSQPFNEQLFGDIEKAAKEIEDTAKIGHKIQHEYGNRPMRGKPTYRGTPRFRGRGSLHYKTGTSSAYGRSTSQPESKNSNRQSGPRPQMRKH